MSAITAVAMRYVSEQLFHALGFWLSLGQSAISILRGESDNEKRQLASFNLMGQMSAYLYVTNRESWLSFCDELGIEPEHVGDEDSSRCCRYATIICPRLHRVAKS